jgi:hypothetical protein
MTSQNQLEKTNNLIKMNEGNMGKVSKLIQKCITPKISHP